MDIEIKIKINNVQEWHLNDMRRLLVDTLLNYGYGVSADDFTFYKVEKRSDNSTLTYGIKA